MIRRLLLALSAATGNGNDRRKTTERGDRPGTP